MALVNAMSSENISESRMFFISMDSARSGELCFDKESAVVGEEEGEDDDVVKVERGGARKTVKVEGPS